MNDFSTNATALTTYNASRKPNVGWGNDALDLKSAQVADMDVQFAMIAGDVWFYAPSLAKTLGYRDAANMIRMLPDRLKGTHKVSTLAGEKGPHKVSTLGGIQEATFVTEAGFYAIVLKSQSPIAEKFQIWVCEDVLPTLRRTGQYSMIKQAHALGISLNFSDLQWEWLKVRPDFVDIIPAAAAGYSAAAIAQMLKYKENKPRSAAGAVVQRIRKLKKLGFLPKTIKPRAQQLEAAILAQA